MKHDERDISTLRHIILYCDEIDEALRKHDLTLEKVKSDSIYKNALSMSVLQIGELANILSQSFRKAHNDMPWSEIKRMRDKAAHHYGEFDVNTLWETVTEDIRPLKEYCAVCIEKLSGIQTASGFQR
jgi:uncharacterized protein with HEPN domain